MKGLIFQQQQQQVLEENMSNLTSQSGTEASVSSGNIRAETAANNFSHQQQFFASPPQPPPKKKRNLPGNPGKFSFFSLMNLYLGGYYYYYLRKKIMVWFM